ncbi:MAG: hypothetical protein LBK59_04535 [Bifidobacteriaceae bacterium]|nr:hypothetical protein [Bifidobacteriaceae bacterium]
MKSFLFFRPLICVGVLLVSMVGCADGPSRDARETSPSADAGVPLVPIGPMPSEPPIVAVDGVRLSPLTYNWVVQGRVELLAPDEVEAEEITIPVVRVDGPLVLEINHPTMPSTLYVTVYGSLDDKHHPTGEGQQIECTADKGLCVVAQEQNRLVLTVARDSTEERLVVLQVGYLAPPDVVDAVEGAHATATASWGVAVAG